MEKKINVVFGHTLLGDRQKRHNLAYEGTKCLKVLPVSYLAG